jgi:hypothetical protein
LAGSAALEVHKKMPEHAGKDLDLTVRSLPCIHCAVCSTSMVGHECDTTAANACRYHCVYNMLGIPTNMYSFLTLMQAAWAWPRRCFPPAAL